MKKLLNSLPFRLLLGIVVGVLLGHGQRQGNDKT